MSRVLGVSILLFSALGIVGCGEPAQVVQYEQGKYQGKADTRAWDNDGTWTKGDRGSWERGIKVRQLTQNEYGRMYGK